VHWVERKSQLKSPASAKKPGDLAANANRQPTYNARK